MIKILNAVVLNLFLQIFSLILKCTFPVHRKNPWGRREHPAEHYMKRCAYPEIGDTHATSTYKEKYTMNLMRLKDYTIPGAVIKNGLKKFHKPHSGLG
jgi:hypothetical protein